MAGLTRVRRFQQDDAHIFCRPDDVQQEIEDMLKFIDFVYGKFGLKYEMFLSTRCVYGLVPPSEPLILSRICTSPPSRFRPLVLASRQFCFCFLPSPLRRCSPTSCWLALCLGARPAAGFRALPHAL